MFIRTKPKSKKKKKVPYTPAILRKRDGRLYKVYEEQGSKVLKEII